MQLSLKVFSGGMGLMDKELKNVVQLSSKIIIYTKLERFSTICYGGKMLELAEMTKLTFFSITLEIVSSIHFVENSCCSGLPGCLFWF